MDEIALNVYKNFMRELSLSRMKTNSNFDDFVIKDLDNLNKTVFAHWVSSILISGKAMRITFKAHFMSQEVRNIVGLKTSAPPEEVSLHKAKDFIKEFCNLVAGHLKIQFESKDIDIGFSLPLVTNGVDELFYALPTGKNVIKDGWTLSKGDNKVVCTLLTEIIDAKLADSINFGDFVCEVEDDGEFDLL